jgi:hypothetical protein
MSYGWTSVIVALMALRHFTVPSALPPHLSEVCRNGPCKIFVTSAGSGTKLAASTPRSHSRVVAALSARHERSAIATFATVCSTSSHQIKVNRIVARSMHAFARLCMRRRARIDNACRTRMAVRPGPVQSYCLVNLLVCHFDLFRTCLARLLRICTWRLHRRHARVGVRSYTWEQRHTVGCCWCC